MNRSLLGRVMAVVLLFYAVSLALFCAYALTRFSNEAYLPSMRFEYAFKRGFSLFCEYLIPVHVAGIAVAVSLAGSPRKRGAPGDTPRHFSALVGSTLLTFMALSVCYTVLLEGFAPGVRAGLSRMTYQTTVARGLLSQAEQARQSGNYLRAVELLDEYLAIDPRNESINTQRLDWQPVAARQRNPARQPAPAEALPKDVDAASLYQKALSFFEKEDWFSAHYYATQAARIDPRRTDAVRLAARAWDKVTNPAPTRRETETADLFRRKTAAYSALVGGDALGAYYSFSALAAQYPKDPDIAIYLAESARKVEETHFFKDEIDQAASQPGSERILFTANGEDGSREAVFFGRMVEIGLGTYFLDVESISYGSSGRVAYHFSAPYGKLAGDTVLLHCVDRADPTVQFAPLYHQGSRPSAISGILKLAPTVPQMRALATGSDGLAAASIAELWSLRGVLGSFGAGEQALSIQLVMRILLPFAFLILSFFSSAFAWALRARYLGRPPILAFLFVPLVPIAAALASLLYLYAHRIVLGFAVLAGGLTAALIVGAGLQLVLLAAALALLAGQTTS